MQLTRIIVSGGVVGLLTAACFHRGAKPPEVGGHDVITQAELDRVSDLSMYEAIVRLRPTFLRNRTTAAHGREPTRQMMLYVDGEKMESIDDLRRYSAAQVHEVHFYEPQIANTRFGRYNNAAGAIELTLRKLDGTQ